MPGIGPKIEAQIVSALADPGEPSQPRVCCSTARGSWSSGIARALGGEWPATCGGGATRCERLAVVVAATEPGPCSTGSPSWPQIVAVVEREERRAVGVTVEGVPVELTVAEPASSEPR